jgi:DNA-binding CsgD family transcriptional regulator
MGLTVMRGETAHAERQIQAVLADVTARGEGVGLNMLGWFQAVMHNAAGNYAQAQTAAELGAEEPLELGPPKWALGELVEAAAHTGDTEAAHEAFEQLSSYAHASGTNLALGLTAAKSALLHRGSAAEDCYQQAIHLLERTTVKVEQARTRLLYGEWLRREGRRLDARSQLRTAYDAFTTMNVAGFAERAWHELAATGETLRRKTTGSVTDLTAQEAHIACLVVDGLTSPEIAAALFLSPRTVEWHLHNMFVKLGVNHRRQFRAALPALFTPTSVT